MERIEREIETNRCNSENVENLRIGQVKEEDSEAFKKAVEFVKQNEGTLHLTAYRDGYKSNGSLRYSIGYGTPSFKGEIITESEAEKRLYDSVKIRWNKVKDLNLTVNQKIGLTSFYYNAGYKSNIHRYIIKGDIKSVIYLMNQYIYFNGKIAGGLVKRRQNEIAMIKNIGQ